MRSRSVRAGALFTLLSLAAVACSSAQGGSGPEDATTELRLGYFPNLTHAAALVGIADGLFEDALGADVTLTPSVFNAGPEALEALLGDQLDATYIGPNPAISAHATSGGEAIRIVSGATSGGAFLVVSKDIKSTEDLKGTTLATPQLGNTQDVALRAWLEEEGLSADQAGGGDVEIAPQANSESLQAFITGEIDGAWVPEPYATRMVREGKGHILVDERDLWPDGAYVTTHLIVRTAFLEENPGVVKALIEGHLAATQALNDDPEGSKTTVNAALEELAGAPIDEAVLDEAWDHLTFTLDPIKDSLLEGAADAETVGLLEPVDLTGIYDLTILNQVLSAAGLEEVAA